MDEATRAMCYALRNPGPGKSPTKLKDIRKMVFKKDGRTRPTLAAIALAARNFKEEKFKRGRKQGQRLTSKDEDRKILNTFKKLRPPGHGIDSNVLKKALPKKLRTKVSRRTIIRRLAEKGYYPKKKRSKTDLGEVRMKKRVAFCKRYEGKNAAQWKSFLQGVGDFKEFTWYPKELRPKFYKLRSSWTYMSKKERSQPAFQRPKRWFKKEEWKKTKKVKVFGLTTSTGKQLCFEVPHGKNQFDAAKWAGFLRSKVAPFLKKTFPGKASFQLLLDGESILHAPEAKRAMKEHGIATLPDWPAYSPELNPQEHVWSRAEPELRESEADDESFEQWKKKVIKAVGQYPSAEKLVASMARRCKDCLARKGAMLDE
jgi:hypothetical protein